MEEPGGADGQARRTFRSAGGMAHFLGACFAINGGLGLAALVTVGSARGDAGGPGGTAVDAIQGDVYALVWLLMVLSPGAVALTLRHLRGHGAGGLGGPAARPRSYLSAYVLATLYSALTLLGPLALGLGHLDPALAEQRAVVFPDAGPGATAAGVVLFGFLVPVLLTLVFLSEEYGWRGFLLARLVESGPVTALGTAGFLYALWLLPLSLLMRLYGETSLWVALPVALVNHTALGAALGYLALRARSVWVPALAQGVLQSQLGLAGLWFTLDQPALTGPLGLAGALLCLAWVGWGIRSGALAACWPPADLPPAQEA